MAFPWLWALFFVLIFLALGLVLAWVQRSAARHRGEDPDRQTDPWRRF